MEWFLWPRDKLCDLVGLTDPDEARNVELGAGLPAKRSRDRAIGGIRERHAPVGQPDVRHGGFTHADVHERDDLLHFRKQRRG